MSPAEVPSLVQESRVLTVEFKAPSSAVVSVVLGIATGAQIPLLAARYSRDLLAEERERVRSLRREQDRDRFLAGRALAKYITREMCSGGTTGWVFRAPPCPVGTAKPRWETPDGLPALGAPSVSISHSGNCVLVAASPTHEVGVDVEESSAVGQLERHALASVFCDAERAALSTLTARTQAFTAKEAALKAIGFGLAVDPLSLKVEGETVLAFDAKEARPLSLRVVDASFLPPGYAATVALAG